MTKLQIIYNQLSSLLSHFTNINAKNLNALPKQIENMIIGENKMPLWANRSIQAVTEDDLDGVTAIGNYAFFNCTTLTSVTIPDSVTAIGDYAFYHCNSLTSITIPDSVTTIGESAFNNCQWLKSITIPDSVTTIGKGAFNNCQVLKSITISDSVTIINENVFYACQSLTSIEIPDSITSIKYGAFGGCSALTDIYFNPTTPPTLGSTSSIPNTTTIHVPIGSGDAYRNATNWSYHASRIVEDIELS